MPRLRHFLVPFAVGAAAGWVAGLLRTPADASADSSAAAATRLPQEEFGDAPVEVAAERSSEPTAEAVVVRPAPADEVAAELTAAVVPQPGATAPNEPESDAAASAPVAASAAGPDEAPAPRKRAGKPRTPRDPDAPKRPRRAAGAASGPEAAAAAAVAEMRQAQTDAVERLGEMERPPGETGG